MMDRFTQSCSIIGDPTRLRPVGAETGPVHVAPLARWAILPISRAATSVAALRVGSRRAVQLAVLSAACLVGTNALRADPSAWANEFPKTDFSRHSIPFGEILSGGPPRDGIPALHDVTLQPVGAERGLEDHEAVIAIEIPGTTARAYPVRYLIWHEIINDRIADQAIAVTYCPLCNSALVFDRTVAGQELSFGVTGRLRNSDMLMYDRETESWWQQATGEGVIGAHAGTHLVAIPSWMEGWQSFRERNPDGEVMVEPDFPRRYGRNPYLGYDRSAYPFLYRGEIPPHDIAPLARVVRVGEAAWPLERLRNAERLVEEGYEFTWRSGLASPLEKNSVAGGRDIGSIRVRDTRTGQDIAHDVMFAFAFHAFFPDGQWHLAIGN